MFRKKPVATIRVIMERFDQAEISKNQLKMEEMADKKKK